MAKPSRLRFVAWLLAAAALLELGCGDSGGSKPKHPGASASSMSCDQSSAGEAGVAQAGASPHGFGRDSKNGESRSGSDQNQPGAGGQTAEAGASAMTSNGESANAGAGGEPNHPVVDPCAQELLVDGDFDQSGTWTESAVPSGYELIVAATEVEKLLSIQLQAPSQPNVLWVGGIAEDTQAAYQPVTIPGNARSLELRGMVLIGTQQSSLQNGDRAGLGFSDALGSQTQLKTFTPLDASSDWQTFTVTIPAGDLSGQSLDFGAVSSTDGFANTNFFFDQLSLRAIVCP